MSDPPDDRRGTRLTLDLWHPDCWGIRATQTTDASLLIHRVHQTDEGTVRGHFTVYAATTAAVEAFLEAVRESPLTHSTVESTPRRDARPNGDARGNTARELFVEYDPDHSIGSALVTHGFINEAPVRVRDGRERWPVFVDDDREGVKDRLDQLRAETDATIEVSAIASTDARAGGDPRRRRLTPRQREAIDLALDRGYYAWPREVTTKDLAADLGVSKTTLLEHLRKAEAKLLDPT